MRRALLIYNPAAGRRRHQRWLPGLVERLSPSFVVEPIATGAPGDATRICRELAAGQGVPQAEVVFILGGDGETKRPVPIYFAESADKNHRYGDVGGPEPNETFARTLLQAHLEAGVRIVAVTDHNSVARWPEMN